MDAALRMFAEKSVDATTIEEITELADLGKGTFYGHFSGKEEVVVALVEDVVNRLIEALKAARPQPRNLHEAVDRLLAVHGDFFLSDHDAFVLLFQGRLLLKLRRDATEDLGQPYLRYLQEVEACLAPFAAQPIEREKVRRLAYAVAGFVSGFFSFAMIGLAAEEIEKSLGPMRQAFVAASEAFLSSQGVSSPPEPGVAAGQPQGPPRAIVETKQ